MGFIIIFITQNEDLPKMGVRDVGHHRFIMPVDPRST
jgi:hypothetical protein